MYYYLKTSNPCNIYSVEIAPWHGDFANNSQYIIFEESQLETFAKLKDEIKICMETFWQGHKFVGGDQYSYVTSGYSSHLKCLKVIKQPIAREENTITCPKNYFIKDGDAEELCRRLKEIIKRYGVVV